MIGRNDPCWCGSGEKWKRCHFPQNAQSNNRSERALAYKKQYGIVLKNEAQIAGIRNACQWTKRLLDELCALAKVGVTTNALDLHAKQFAKKMGAESACLGYGSPPYPKHICTSLNEVICHGIPDERPLQEGDILNIDVSLIVEGYYGDCSAMVMIGTPSEEAQRVVKASYESLMRAIEILKPGVMLYEIGNAIDACARSYGCSVVDQFVGHGIGLDFHEAPQVCHHVNTVAIPLAPGMTFTIEPMINAGVKEGVLDPSNGWVVRTVDGRPSAQWEHTLLITESGYEILTQ